MGTFVRRCLLVAFLAGTTGYADNVAPSTVPDSSANPKPTKKYDKDGMYVRGFLINNSIGGDFNDTIYLNNGSLAVDVPKIEDGSGWGVAWGGRRSGKYFGGGVEFSYSRSTHETSSVLLGPSEAAFNALDLTLLMDVKTIYGLRPYGSIGCGANWLTLENGSTDGDATFSGYSFFYGVGLEYFVTPNWCLNAGIGHRATTFTTVEGISIIDDLDASGATSNIGVSYIFN